MNYANLKFYQKGFISLEIATYFFILLSIILTSLKLNQELHKNNIQSAKGYLNDFKKN
jgi:hypothetical protein